jgi:glucose/arabinose dehydrogenase
VPAVDRGDTTIEAGVQPRRFNREFSRGTVGVVPNGLTSPVRIANAGDGGGRLFVVEQAGYIRVVKNGVLLSTPYLTLTSKVLSGGERGLLSVAFDPNYKTNRTFYVYYTALNGAVTIERYVVTNPASDVAVIANSTLILSVAHPASNTMEGLQFGPDGYLYAGLGDGGGAGDQHGAIGNGQNPGVLLGKILRLNVRGVPTYTIPVSNPFTQTVGYRPEIWALGVRNPWRFSFDRRRVIFTSGTWARIALKRSITNRGQVPAAKIMAGA